MAGEVAPAAPDKERTIFERPVAPIQVVCPVCGVGGELAGEALLGSSVCGSPDHPSEILLRVSMRAP